MLMVCHTLPITKLKAIPQCAFHHPICSERGSIPCMWVHQLESQYGTFAGILGYFREKGAVAPSPLQQRQRHHRIFEQHKTTGETKKHTRQNKRHQQRNETVLAVYSYRPIYLSVMCMPYHSVYLGPIFLRPRM